MRSINIILAGVLLWSLACEDEQIEFENPLDLYEGDVPALVFNPNKIDISVGDSTQVGVYVLEAADVSGVHAQIQYDTTKLSVSSVTVGSFFVSDQAPIFIFQNQGGTLDIFSYYLGSDKSVTGTGIIGTVTFNAKVPGNSEIKFTTQSELVDPSDQPIEIRSLGQGVINAQ